MTELGLPPPPWIVGHRGVRGPVPENTVASLREAVAQRADMVELDLQLMGDGRLLVHHDRTVRCADGASRPVDRVSLEALRGAPRAGAEPAAGELERRAPTLEEVLVAAPRELPLNLEIKRHDPAAAPGPLIEALARAIAGRPRVLLSSFDWPALARARGRLPAVPVAPLADRQAGWDELLEVARRLGAFSVHLDRELAADLGRRGRLGEASGAGMAILAYTVNRVEDARELLDLGVSGLFSDRPGELRRELLDAC